MGLFHYTAYALPETCPGANKFHSRDFRPDFADFPSDAAGFPDDRDARSESDAQVRALCVAPTSLACAAGFNRIFSRTISRPNSTTSRSNAQPHRISRSRQRPPPRPRRVCAARPACASPKCRTRSPSRCAIAATIAAARSVHRVSVPVISVGNLTLGGTGKTPMVKWLARRLRERGSRVAIVSRGYGAAAGQHNDEALELAQALPDVPHVQNRDRVAAARAGHRRIRSAGAAVGRRLPTPPPRPRSGHRAARRTRAVRLRPRVPPRHAARAARRLSAGPRRLPQPRRRDFRCRARRHSPPRRQTRSASRLVRARPRGQSTSSTSAAKRSRSNTSPANASPRSAASATRPAFATRSPRPAAKSPPGASSPTTTRTRQPISRRSRRRRDRVEREFVVCTQKDLVKVHARPSSATYHCGPSRSRCNFSAARESLEKMLERVVRRG